MKNAYLLLTPGPLSTSESVREAMLKDWCTWDDDYNLEIVEVIRRKLVTLATTQSGYTSVLMQGSGTASVEATIGSVMLPTDKLLVIDNGAYGARIAQIAQYLNIACRVIAPGETAQPNLDEIAYVLTHDPAITHVAIVHCETTTGMLNPIAEVAKIAKQHGKRVILDAMSSFGGIPMDIGALGIDFMISSANKCIQGVPGFGFVIAKRIELEQCQGRARSLTLDLFDQWQCMEKNHGKWRFTSPTHTVRAFYQALLELENEGGIAARYQRYQTNQTQLVKGMRELGFAPLLPEKLHSPIITSFYSPEHSDYQFAEFYQRLKQQGFVIYPGKVSHADCFRIGNIGEVYPQDIERLLSAMRHAMYWQQA
ncbi:2-aminoethylphosphonate--pyruvate transaminase [Vibrio cholerae]|uniref:2-aminoethylphosphonate--pyruvate transaminase n=1 Tax=Vibrio cholerae TaxID=666 RepID=A0A655ZKP1_VIBCL|nr:2-aminoethylphosphonate--pyruvate transaminase [Vibrio cholerae]EKF9167989.1 2-aminoethylphosphonate--pyruvate transaminase [Vibrio cholerae]ELJ8738020.1 2-aminoethylphosphonate--pyruvate transaminase [Vibrio cholerae]MDA5313443.1 2-aminoethylphosphonate--pyruvate transaminase [Vibrio cholerae]MDN6969696.1 2-aminoethylphosphonate--pyruvate transaminase [Vibrio cholerae]CSC72541.1 2-aminoethylphosphonate--pyruvate transaminase [Vibrio cholerae]